MSREINDDIRVMYILLRHVYVDILRVKLIVMYQIFKI